MSKRANYMHTHIHNGLPKMKSYAIALSWLGMQAPTEEVRVVVEVPPEVDEGMYNYFYVHVYVHLTTAAKYHLACA